MLLENKGGGNCFPAGPSLSHPPTGGLVPGQWTREGGRLRSDPGQESRESKDANSRAALGVKRL